MSKEQQLKQDIANIRNDLLTAIIQSESRADIGKKNESKVVAIADELEKAIIAKTQLKEGMDYMVTIYKNIEKYAQDRKELAVALLKDAIAKAGDIVTAANLAGIKLSVGENNAKILFKNGQDINAREGSACRAVMGALVRYTLVLTQPDALRVLFLDEGFGVLSDETAIAFKESINAMKEELLIVGVEQHNTLYGDLADCVFYVEKDNKTGVTNIRKEEVQK